MILLSPCNALLMVLATSKTIKSLAGSNYCLLSVSESMAASIKALAESPGLTSIPSSYTFIQNPNDHQAASDPEPEDSIPIIDFSLLNSSNPDQRSKVIQDLGKACRDWGFFMVCILILHIPSYLC